MNHFREIIHPGLRGAIFYAAYWGAVGMYDPFLNVYFLGLGINATQIGWLAAVLPLCTMVIAPLVTRLADRLHRRVVILALACLAFGAALTLPALPGFKPDFALLIGFVALYAAFRSPIVSLADSLIAQMASHHTLDFGSMRLWGSIVFTISATSLGYIWQRTGFPTMFLAAGLGFVPVVVTALLLEESPRLAHPSEQAAARRPLDLRAFDPSLFFLLGATFLIIAALFMAGTFGSVYMIQLGGSAMMAGAMNGIAAMGEVPGMLYGLRVARKIGATNALVLAYAIVAFGLAATGLVSSPWPLLLLALFRGLGFGLLLVSTVMTINTRAPREYTSTFQGILNAACWGLAPLLGGPISGWIFQNHGPSALFFTAAAMALVSAALITPTYRLWKASKTPAQADELTSPAR